MKIKYGIFAGIGIAGIFLAGCAIRSPADVEGPQSTMGFNGPLKLVAKYKRLHLYIYADTSSTNRHPDYIIFQGNEPLVIADNKSNTVEIIHCEKNFHGQLATTYDYKGRLLKRSFSTLGDNSIQTNYLFFDNNGDGQWDFLHINGTNAESSGSFVRSNLCWVPRVEGK